VIIRRRVASLIVLLAPFACAPAPPAASTPAVVEVRPAPASSAVANSIVATTTDADATVAVADAAVASADASTASTAAMGPPRISCKTDDDCWVSNTTTAAQPIRRPAKLRGKKFRPCVDGDAQPICNGTYCTTMGFGW
jgi:hypothetical protein